MLVSTSRPAKCAVALRLGVVTMVWASPARSQAIRSPEEIQRIFTIEKLSVQDGAVSGEVHNLSSRTVRDVQLFIRHTWLWDNERHPGTMDPGASAFETLRQEIPPGGTARFSFTHRHNWRKLRAVISSPPFR